MRTRRVVALAVVTMAAVASVAVAATRNASKPAETTEPISCTEPDVVEGVTADGVAYGISAISCEPETP